MKVDELEKVFRIKVNVWSKKMQVFPFGVRLAKMDKAWGCCTSDGVVMFNSELLFLDDAAQNFVIIHELLHLKIPNHNKLFKATMTAYLPDWQQIERRLCQQAQSVCAVYESSRYGSH